MAIFANEITRIMKKCLIIPLALLFSLSACTTTKRHSQQTTVAEWSMSDSLRSASDSVAFETVVRDSLHTGAAFGSQQAGQGRSTEIDTSRTVIVTEFGPDGLPVRQTETRMAGVARQWEWCLEQQLRLDAYLERFGSIATKYERYLNETDALHGEQGQLTSDERHEQEPARMPVVVKWTIIVQYLLCLALLIFGTVLAVRHSIQNRKR